MKGRKIFLLFVAIFVLTGCTSNRQKLEEYLKENNYEEKKNCLRKEIEKEDSKEIIKYCFDECKVYMSDLSLDDYFVMDFKTKNIQYIYSYITYQSNIDRDEDICLFQGEEIDLESSYCKTAKTAFERQLSRLEKEVKDANVNIKRICK